MFFFLILNVRRPFRRKDFKRRKWGYGVIFVKSYKQNLLKERKQPPVDFQQQTILFNVFILCLWLRIFQGVWFMNSPSWLSEVNRGYRVACWRKIICDCFCSLWLWLVIVIMKRCPERYPLQLYRTSLKYRISRCSKLPYFQSLPSQVFCSE